MTPDRLAQEAKRLAGEYFDLGVQEGADARAFDTPDGAAQRTLTALEATIDAMAERIAELEAKCKSLNLECEAHAALRRLECAELTKRAESAEALVEQYRQDAERLDWMSEHGLSMDVVADPDNLTVVFYGTYPCKQAYGRTLRDAIDAALQQEKSNA